MTSWNLKKLREYSETFESEKQNHIERINSIGRAIDIYTYHLSQAKEANDRIEPSNISEAMQLVLTPEVKRAELVHEKIVIQANTQAAIHSARAIHDLFAQLVNGFLLSDSISVDSCDIVKVKNKLSNSILKAHIDDLLKSEEYKYVNAFVNNIKHRSLVSFGAHVSLENGESGVQFRSFEYKGVCFDSLWAEQVLEKSLKVKNAVVIAGAMLNKQLGINNV